MEESGFFIPVGFKFRPSDQQLLEDYLYKKVSGIPIPCVDYIVKECDLYGKREPRQIWESNRGTQWNEDDDLYFFTKLKKKTPKGSRIDRKIGSGAWQGEDAPTQIASSISEQIIGSKKRFRFEKEGSEENGGWIMHEYTLHPSLLGKNQSTNYVLCRMRKNQPTRTGREKKSGFAKKRKLQDFQNNSQSVDPYTVFTKEENKNDVMIDQSFQRKEAVGMDCSGVAGAGQYEVPMSMRVPEETIQALPQVQSAEPEKMMTQQQNHSKFSFDNDRNSRGRETDGIDSGEFAGELEDMLLEQDNEYDPLSRISDEDMCLLRKLFDKDPIENSVDWVNMPCMKEMLSELPELLSEEYVFVPDDDGKSATTTSSSVDMMRNEQRLSDPGGVSEGIHQRIENVSNVPLTFLSRSVMSEIPEENVVALGENVDWDIMQSMSELPQLCELPQLPSEEIFVAPTDGQIVTRTSVDWATTTHMQTTDYGSTCSSLCGPSLNGCQFFDPPFFDGEDFLLV